jgi:NADP-reducing hydrogenase subunit HndC
MSVPRVIERLPYTPLAEEVRIVLTNVGCINPDSIEEAIAAGAYQALGRVLTDMSPVEVIDLLKASGLQGRGGAGFPAGLKWQFTAQTPADVRYIICNADESEPGTFKDRLLLEGDPHRILEGMAIAGYAVAAQEGYVYIRGEYTVAMERMERAIEQAEEYGLLGENILGSDFSFHVHAHSGAGAYICGEETALIESLEGHRGHPRLRPPYPPSYGLWGKPTVVNNVETLGNVPPIILNGADWFRSFGTEKCPGTKVYSISGHVNRPGLIEVPMGITLRRVIESYSGGMKEGRAFKLAQTGGSAGSIVPASMLDVSLDYASMAGAGASLGSGALLICDETTCVVDLCLVISRFFNYESCGKCTPCRLGNIRTYETLQRMTRGQGRQGDIEYLDRIAESLSATAFCGLGQAAAVPIKGALRHFRSEFEQHIQGICPTGVCAMSTPVGELKAA